MNDYLGQVTGLVDAGNGTRVAEYEYDPFGRPLRTTGTYAEENPIRFSSQYTDQETGLVYFGFRYYHPQWGRLLNRDPIEEEGGINLYQFVSNDPVNRWDLLGLAIYDEGYFGTGAGFKAVAADLRSGSNTGVGGFFNEVAANLYSAVGAAITPQDQHEGYNNSVDRIAAASSGAEGGGIVEQVATVGAATISEAVGTTNLVEAAAGVDVQGNDLDGAGRLQTGSIGVTKLAGAIAGAKSLADSATPSAPAGRTSSLYEDATRGKSVPNRQTNVA
mgnify:CR=1 FL=1